MLGRALLRRTTRESVELYTYQQPTPIQTGGGEGLYICTFCTAVPRGLRRWFSMPCLSDNLTNSYVKFTLPTQKKQRTSSRLMQHRPQRCTNNCAFVDKTQTRVHVHTRRVFPASQRVFNHRHHPSFFSLHYYQFSDDCVRLLLFRLPVPRPASSLPM